MSSSRRDAIQAKVKAAAVQVGDFTGNRWVMFTQKFILVLVGIIIVVDLFLAFNEMPGDTISEVLKNWAYRRFFVITWIWGVLAGHLFLTNTRPIFGGPVSITVLLGLSLLLLLAGLPLKGTVIVPVQLALLALGTLAGYLLWPQSPVA